MQNSTLALSWTVQTKLNLVKSNCSSISFSLCALKRFFPLYQATGIWNFYQNSVYLFTLKYCLKFVFCRTELILVPDVIQIFKHHFQTIKRYWIHSMKSMSVILRNSYESYVDALGTCQFDYLFEERENHCHRFAEGLPNNERTKSLLPPSRFECHGRSLRNSANISQIPVRTKHFENSPIPYFIKILNK